VHVAAIATSGAALTAATVALTAATVALAAHSIFTTSGIPFDPGVSTLSAHTTLCAGC
jgi:hypothetical protein